MGVEEFLSTMDALRFDTDLDETYPELRGMAQKAYPYIRKIYNMMYEAGMLSESVNKKSLKEFQMPNEPATDYEGNDLNFDSIVDQAVSVIDRMQENGEDIKWVDVAKNMGFRLETLNETDMELLHDAIEHAMALPGIEEDEMFSESKIREAVEKYLKENYTFDDGIIANYQPGKYYVYELFYNMQNKTLEPDSYGTYNDIDYDSPEEAFPQIKHNASIPVDSVYNDRFDDGNGEIPVFAICAANEDGELIAIDNNFYVNQKFANEIEGIKNGLAQMGYTNANIKTIGINESKLNESYGIGYQGKFLKKGGWGPTFTSFPEDAIKFNNPKQAQLYIDNNLDDFGASVVSLPLDESKTKRHNMPKDKNAAQRKGNRDAEKDIYGDGFKSKNKIHKSEKYNRQDNKININNIQNENKRTISQDDLMSMISESIKKFIKLN